jgi:hypothetical protein
MLERGDVGSAGTEDVADGVDAAVELPPRMVDKTLVRGAVGRGTGRLGRGSCRLNFCSLAGRAAARPRRQRVTMLSCILGGLSSGRRGLTIIWLA